MIRVHTVLAAILFYVTTPVTRQLDHILIESSDPKALFALFADTLQFPVAWPLSENQGYVTGGVGAGNVNLEFFAYRSIPSGLSRTHYYGLAFEPYPLSDALKRLQSLGISYGSPEPYTTTLPNGTRGIGWTTVALPTVSKPATSVFLYEYSPAFLKVDVRRKQLGNRLTLNNGGPLGLVSVREVVIVSSTLKHDTGIWSQLLGTPAKAGSWRAGAGPAIRLVQGKEDRIWGLTLKVQSLDRAKSFLKTNRLLGSVSANGALISPLKVQGLQILLSE